MLPSNKAVIFISLCSANKAIASSLCDLIQSSYHLNAEEIICTSAQGHGLNNGAPSYITIKTHIENSKLVIYLFSKDFCHSEDCLYEIAWGFNLPSAFYLHVDDVTSQHKPHCVSLSSMNNLDKLGLTELRIRLKSILSKDVDERIWASKEDKILEEIEKEKSKSTLNEIFTKPPTIFEQEKTLTRLIDDINNHTELCCICVDKVHTSCGTKRKNDFVFLPEEEAEIQNKRGTLHLLNKKIVACQVLENCEVPVHGLVIKGNIYPFADVMAKRLIEIGKIKKIDGIRDLQTSTKLFAM